MGVGRWLTLADGTQVGCRQLIVADGARSSLSRKLGRRWHQETVYGVAARGYLATARSDDPWLTSHLELRSPDGDIEAAGGSGAATADVLLRRPAP